MRRMEFGCEISYHLDLMAQYLGLNRFKSHAVAALL